MFHQAGVGKKSGKSTIVTKHENMNQGGMDRYIKALVISLINAVSKTGTTTQKSRDGKVLSARLLPIALPVNAYRSSGPGLPFPNAPKSSGPGNFHVDERPANRCPSRVSISLPSALTASLIKISDWAGDTTRLAGTERLAWCLLFYLPFPAIKHENQCTAQKERASPGQQF
ncbi:hypothetical protein CC2G_005152 [Coprinopsis cinerea AmutBmut pab1-1]|nr:hypothetical protein CC2G_005152 [Coprinopsis cinerea AmutBmut pab1-1]